MPRQARKKGYTNASQAHQHEEAGPSLRTTRSLRTSPPASHPPIFTIGHGTRSLPDLIHIIQSANVKELVDVRSIPQSWTNPQFNRDTLLRSTELQGAGIDYVWMGDSLGGRRTAHQPHVERHTAIRVAAFRNYAGYMCTATFARGLMELMTLADTVASSTGGRVAIMCSETLWWRCHRRMIADALVTSAWQVQHLGLGKHAMEHERWEIARVGEDGSLVYDVV